MTGPEHFREGERLLALAENMPSHRVAAHRDDINPAVPILTAQATAHFLAAQVALAALCAPITQESHGAGHPSELHYKDWVDAVEIGEPDYEGVAFGGTTDPSIVSQQNAENDR